MTHNLSSEPRLNAAEADLEHRLLERLLDDGANGNLKSVEEYQQLFPNHDALVARVFAEIASDGKASFEGKSRLGPYVLLEEIGRGGQGTVFLARDERLPRLVALKLVSNAGDRLGPTRIERFRREAQAASKLDHAGICAVYETGDIDDILFLAMRYVPGESLAMHIARSAAREKSTGSRLDLPVCETELSTTTRRREFDATLQLIERAARALHVAHEAGVVHRDIKPGNIVVTPEGEPVLLDFGLARDFDQMAPGLTQTDEVFGTPSYMALEQLRPNRHGIDRRADVYALGVTLFECLTLQRPYGERNPITLADVLERDQAPDPRDRVPALPKDLSIVLASAMSARAGNRYQTALEFAEDLRAVRQLKPIRAQKAGAMLRLWRWMQRNPALAASQILVFLSLSIGLAVSQMAYAEADNERKIAKREAQHRGDINEYMHWVLSSPSPFVMGRDTPISKFLERAVERVDEKFAERPRTRAELLNSLGKIHTSLGLHGPAAELLKRSADIYGEFDSESAAVSNYMHAYALKYHIHDQDEYFAQLQTAVDRLAEHFEDSDVRMVDVRTDLGLVLVDGGHLEEATAILRGIDRIADASDDPRIQMQRLKLRTNVHMHAGRWSQALESCQALLALPIDEDNPSSLYDRYGALQNATHLAMHCGKQGDALQTSRESLAHIEELFGKGDDHTSVALSNHATLLRMSGQHAHAVEPYQEALRISRAVHEAPNKTIALNLNNLGALQQFLGNLDEAKNLLTEAYDMLVAMHGEKHISVAKTMSNIADVHRDLGDLKEALSWQHRTLKTQRETGGDSHYETVNTLFRTADLEARAKNYTKAMSLCEEALPLTRKLDPGGRYRVLRVANMAAMRVAESAAPATVNPVAIVRETLAQIDELEPDNVPLRIRHRVDLAVCLQHAGKLDDAIGAFVAARDMVAADVKEHKETVRLHDRIAEFESATGKRIPGIE